MLFERRDLILSKHEAFGVICAVATIRADRKRIEQAKLPGKDVLQHMHSLRC
jgi:hypothetical protein